MLFQSQSFIENKNSKLLEQANEVNNITEMILQVSNQTNLLALNASIESARAGEAGRGFAVVADQIRQLAEQTKTATENISNLLEALAHNAVEATESVESSLKDIAEQQKFIDQVYADFTKVNESMGGLTNHIEEVDTQVQSLSGANNIIVDNITLLSATSEEITASSEEVSNVMKRNVESFEEVVVKFNRPLL